MTVQFDSRRKFLKITAAGAVAGALGQRVFANQRLMMTEDDPMGKALGYVADVNEADMSKHTMYKAGDTCANCMQFKSMDENGVGECSIFPGKGVQSKAWCKAWVKQ